jgi:hypothetical protein
MSQTRIHSPKRDQNTPAARLRGRTRFYSGRGGPNANPPALQAPAVAVALLVLTGLGLAVARPARAQDERRTKVPVIGKIAGGSSHQAFSGKVKSVDLKRELLSVGTVEGGATEFFPIKKNVSVQSADGTKLKVKELTPGTNIIVYYDVKEDRRSVSEIMVLGTLGGDEKSSGAKDGKDAETKKPAPTS